MPALLQYVAGAVSAIAVDGEGRIYVSDSVRIKVFDANGRYLNSFEVGGGVFGLVFNDQDELLMAESDHVSIAALNER